MRGRRFVILILVILSALIVNGAIFYGWIDSTIERLPFPRSTLEELHAGMTQEDVQELLGKPGYVWPDGTWVYGAGWTQVLVYFDADGTTYMGYEIDY